MVFLWFSYGFHHFPMVKPPFTIHSPAFFGGFPDTWQVVPPPSGGPPSPVTGVTVPVPQVPTVPVAVPLQYGQFGLPGPGARTEGGGSW